MKVLQNVIKNYLNRFVNPFVVRKYCSSANSGMDDMAVNKNRIVWIDLEMSGLNIDVNHILEVACLITDENLNIVSDEFHMVLHQPDSILNNMDDWCQNQHSKTGLIEASKNSTFTEKFVEDSLVSFMMKYIPKGKCPLAGSSVYFDRLWLRKFMPVANEYMHYRIIDVSTVKELARRWNPDVYKNIPEKELTHRALDDIKESIQELNYYRQNLFKPTS